MTIPLLSVQNVSKRFAGVEALCDVSFDVRVGEIVALIGPNGAGKTTLLNIVCGALRPSRGVVRLRGADIHGCPPHAVTRMGIARTFQTVELFRRLTVRENVMAGAVPRARIGIVGALLGQWSRGPRRKALDAEVNQWLAVVGLDAADQHAGALPAGQQRLLAIARALATGGKILVLDEPGAGLNQVEKGRLAGVLARLRADGKTIVFVEHDMTLVGRLADRVIVLADGRRIAEGSPETVRGDPGVVEAYLGLARLPARGAAPSAADRRGATAASVPSRSSGVLLSARDVEVAYGGLRALRGVSFDVRQGEIVAVVGANGAGKSTLLKTIARVVRNHHGVLAFDGLDLTRLRPEAVARAGIRLVPEGRELFSSLTVWDNLLLGRYAKGRTWRAGLEEAVEQVFALFPVLRKRRRQFAGTLSGGEGQMLAIGRALMSAPRLLMLDEPSLGLAPQVVAHIMDRLVDLRALGLTIVLVEQNARAALEIADRGYVLETGRVAVEGSGRDLLADPEITNAYLGRISDGTRLTAPLAGVSAPADERRMQ